uniref:Uncharacterized protein n=1 Tax=Corvus moneduloides TaxID=1196302 RepID=A0A8C3H2J4_CORMO
MECLPNGNCRRNRLTEGPTEVSKLQITINKLGHTGKEALCFAAQSKGWPLNRKTCATILTECCQYRLKLQLEHPAKAPPLHISKGKALWSTWQIDSMGPLRPMESAGHDPSSQV